MPLVTPPLPPGPHPSLLAANQQRGYQQNPQQMPQQQHQAHPQQMPPLPMPPPNMQQLQPPSHLPLLPHPHLPRPPQMPPHGVRGSLPAPSSMPTSHPSPMPGPMGMPGTMNQMVPPMPQGHFMGMNPMHSGSLTTSAAPSVGGFPNGLPNMQGPSNATGAQMYPQGGSFNRPPGVQMPMMPGLIPTSLGINLVCLHHYHHVLRLIPNHLSRSLFHHRAAAAAYMWMETTTCTGLLALVLTHVHFNSLGYSFCLFSAFIV